MKWQEGLKLTPPDDEGGALNSLCVGVLSLPSAVFDVKPG